MIELTFWCPILYGFHSITRFKPLFLKFTISRSASTSSASGTGSAAAPLVANINVAVRVRYLGPGVVIFVKESPSPFEINFAPEFISGGF